MMQRGSLTGALPSGRILQTGLVLKTIATASVVVGVGGFLLFLLQFAG